MTKIAIVGKPSPAIARIIAEKQLDVEFIGENEAKDRFNTVVDKLPRLDAQMITRLKAMPPRTIGKSKFHK